MWGQIIGGALGLAGSALGGSSTPKYRPWDINVGGVGSVDFDRKNKTVTGSLDPKTQALMDQLYGTATGPGYGQGMAQFGQGMVGMMPGLFQDSQSASFLNPAILSQFQGVLNPAIQNSQGYAQNFMGMGQNMFGGGGPGGPQASQMFNTGMGMVGEMPGQSYQDVAQGRVDLLRQQAAPYENRAQNAMFQKLQSMGQLGMPSAQRNIEAFGTGLGQADLARQMEGQNLAEGLYGRDLQYSLGRNQLGGNMATQGMQGMFQGAGMGMDFMNMGVGANTTAANLGNMGYAANMGFSDATNARAQQRMGSAVNMFGFGQDAQSQDLQQALAAMGGYQNFQGGLNSLIQIGANMGSQNASAAGQYGQQQNPWGQIAQGVGYGMMNGNYSGMFAQPGQMNYQQQPIYPGGGIPMVNQPTTPINVSGPSGGIRFGNMI